MIAGILLAAGRGTRFGTDKRLHDVAGHPLIHYALRAATGSRIPSLYVVLGPDDKAVREAIESRLPAGGRTQFVQNDQPARGMMLSVKTAIGALPARCEAAVVIHGDMPLIPSSLIDRLIDEFERTGEIVVPESRGEWQHPRVIPRWLFEAFLNLGDDERGIAILEKHRKRVTRVPVQDHHCFIDVDVPADLRIVQPLLAEA